MAATQLSLAEAARKYSTDTSASIDPFEEPDVDASDTAAIQEWLQYVERSMAAHRSPFIAAEILLKEMNEFAQRRLRRPERLYVATALPVLHHCLPSLAAEHRDIIVAAVHELIPAMAFTKVCPAALSGRETATRVSYAECFWRVQALFMKHKRTIEVHARRCEVETAVMDRVVLSLDRLWVRMCFLSWRIYCRQFREKKLLFRKLALRGMAGHIVPQYIRAWRQHAHSLMLKAKVARSSEVARELEALYPQEQHAKGLHERTNEEVREKMRLLKEETAHTEQIRAKLETLKMLHEEAEQSLEAHWQAWRTCVTVMFGDSHPINKTLEEDFSNHVAYQQNITDTGETYSRRARARTGRVGLKQIQACLLSQGYLASHSDGDAHGDDVAADHVPAPSVPALPKKAVKCVPPESQPQPFSKSRKMRYVKPPPASASVDATIAALRDACAPVVSPLHLIDLLRGNQATINVALSFIFSMYSGGHCSLFWPPSHATLRSSRTSVTLQPPATAARRSRSPSSFSSLASSSAPSAAVSSSVPPLAAERGTNGDAEILDDSDASDAREHTPSPPANITARMIDDVDVGMKHVATTSEGNDRHLLAIRRCMESNSMDAVQEYVGGVFARWSTMGLPLNREKVEKALMALVRPVDGPVIHELYPAKGIGSFTELSEYLAKVAEFSSIPLISIAERLENGYVFSPREEMLYTLNTNEDIRAVLRENHEHIVRLLEWSKDEPHPEQLNKDRIMNVLTVKIGLSADFAEEVWRDSGNEAEVVAKGELEELLYLAAAYLDPSPFTSPAEKIANVLDLCVPFLLDL